MKYALLFFGVAACSGQPFTDAQRAATASVAATGASSSAAGASSSAAGAPSAAVAGARSSGAAGAALSGAAGTLGAGGSGSAGGSGGAAGAPPGCEWLPPGRTLITRAGCYQWSSPLTISLCEGILLSQNGGTIRQCSLESGQWEPGFVVVSGNAHSGANFTVELWTISDKE